MHFTHIQFKPTKRIKTDFNILEEIKDVEIPKESQVFIKRYVNSKKTSDKFDKDLTLIFEREMIYGFDFIHNNQKILIPELNPVTIFYSNAVMSHRRVIIAREELFKKSPRIDTIGKEDVNPRDFGIFFQFATNCLINLQATVESFVNRQIPPDKEFIDRNGYLFEPSIVHKITVVVPELKERNFKKSFKRDNFRVRKVIELRNEIIHLTPATDETNTQYKDLYRRLLMFDFTKAVLAVQKFVNFYEEGLIEECPCGEEHYYEITSIKKEQ